MREVHSIPAAPRRARLGALVAFRWPLLVLGLLSTITGGLVSWMLFLADGAKPSDQHRLDTEPTVRAEGEVTSLDPPVTGADGRTLQLVRYTFDWDKAPMRGVTVAEAGAFAVAQRVAIELLPAEPNRNRIVGTVLHIDRAWLRPKAWLTLLATPGVLLLLGWLAGAFRLRHVLVHGDVSPGTVREVRMLRWLLPETLVVAYEFRDRRASVRRGRHWVRLRSPLGQRLWRQHVTGWTENVPVLHDRTFPLWNRMLQAGDFLPSPATAIDPQVDPR